MICTPVRLFLSHSMFSIKLGPSNSMFFTITPGEFYSTSDWFSHHTARIHHRTPTDLDEIWTVRFWAEITLSEPSRWLWHIHGVILLQGCSCRLFWCQWWRSALFKVRSLISNIFHTRLSENIISAEHFKVQFMWRSCRPPRLCPGRTGG